VIKTDTVAGRVAVTAVTGGVRRIGGVATGAGGTGVSAAGPMGNKEVVAIAGRVAVGASSVAVTEMVGWATEGRGWAGNRDVVAIDAGVDGRAGRCGSVSVAETSSGDDRSAVGVTTVRLSDVATGAAWVAGGTTIIPGEDRSVAVAVNDRGGKDASTVEVISVEIMEEVIVEVKVAVATPACSGADDRVAIAPLAGVNRLAGETIVM
jgi:hypothetical protein